MGRGRVHSCEFKLSIVRQVASGEQRPTRVCREHGIAEGLLLRWRRKYEARLAGIGAHISMAATGNPDETAKAESIFKTFKCEEVYVQGC